jgi:hypothetical protein
MGMIKRIRNILPLRPIFLRFKPKLSNSGPGAFSPFVFKGDGLGVLAFGNRDHIPAGCASKPAYFSLKFFRVYLVSFPALLACGYHNFASLLS